MENRKKRFFKQFDSTLFFTVILLSIFGIIAIGSATASNSSGSLPYIRTQLVSTLLGLFAVFLIMKIDYEILGKFYIPIYIASILLLSLTFFFGTGGEEWGGESWVRIGPVGFQPAEIVKIGLIVSVAKLIEVNQYRLSEPLVFLKIVAFAGLPIFLILLQPDFGTAMVYVFFTGVMLFIAGLDLKYFLVSIGALVLSSPFLWLSLGEYQKNRILNLLDPSRDSQGSGYQVLQSKIAIGSGKIFGMGFLNGNQTQYGFLPEKHTDFIFAVIGEEFGLLIGLVVIGLMFLLLYRLVLISKSSRDMFGSLVVVGVAAMMFVHIVENIGMTMGIMPVTGIPLPFLSYGGTFQLTNMIAIGLVLNISLKRDNLSF